MMTPEQTTNTPKDNPKKTMYQRIMAGEIITRKEEVKFLKERAKLRAGENPNKLVWDDDHGDESVTLLFPVLERRAPSWCR